MLNSAVPVVKSEKATGEPPLDGSAEGSPPAPAIWIALALAVPRIVDAGQKAAVHKTTLVGRNHRRSDLSRVGTAKDPTKLELSRP